MSDKDLTVEAMRAAQNDPDYLSGDPVKKQAALNRAAAGIMQTAALARRARQIQTAHPDAQLAPDGHFYIKDTTPGREGKYQRVD